MSLEKFAFLVLSFQKEDYTCSPFFFSNPHLHYQGIEEL